MSFSKLSTDTRLLGNFTPIQRILLTANGSIQRILSAYYNGPVQIKILKNEEESNSHLSMTIINREIELLINNKPVCHAISLIRITSLTILESFYKEPIGIAQLFQLHQLYPNFTLKEAGLLHRKNCYRIYDLSAPGISCHICEIFDSNLL
jgi:hypothetical protein